MPSVRVRVLFAAGLVAASAVAMTTVASPASAMGKVVLRVAYKASGTSVIKSTGSTVTLAPTTLTTGLDKNGYFTGTLPLKPATASFKLAGLVPVTATVTFVPVGATTGRLTSNPTTRVTATAKYTLKLSNVTLAGLIPTFVGNSCETVAPAKITVATPKGKTFDLTKGGTVTGTYAIGQFANCGFTTALINQLIPGAGNTVSFTLSGGKILGQ